MVSGAAVIVHVAKGNAPVGSECHFRDSGHPILGKLLGIKILELQASCNLLCELIEPVHDKDILGIGCLTVAVGRGILLDGNEKDGPELSRPDFFEIDINIPVRKIGGVAVGKSRRKGVYPGPADMEFHSVFPSNRCRPGSRIPRQHR